MQLYNVIGLSMVLLYAIAPFVTLYKGSDYELAKMAFVHLCVLPVVAAWIYHCFFKKEKTLKIHYETIALAVFIFWSGLSLLWAKNSYIGFQINSHDIEILTRLSKALWKMNKTSAAKAIVMTAAEQYPYHIRFNAFLGKLYSDSGDNQKAIEAY